MSGSRKRTDASQSSGVEVDMQAIFESAQARLTEKEDVLQRVRLLETAIAQKSDLFDAEDVARVRTTLESLEDEYEYARRNMSEAQELYQRMIHDLELKMGERLELLDSLDRERGAVSANPELLEYFSRKQAVYRQGINDAKRHLLEKIRERLSISDGHVASRRA